MRLLIVGVLVLAGCGERTFHRWPHHRRERDDGMAELARKTEKLEARIKSLEQHVANLQAAPQPVVAAQPAPQPVVAAQPAP
jgi:hypothetical protein